MVYVPYLSHSIHKGLHIHFKLKCNSIYRPLNTWGYTDKSYAIKSRFKSVEQLSRKVQPSTKDVLTTNAMHNI